MCPAELGGDASRRHIFRGGCPVGGAVRCWHLEGGPTMYQVFHAPHSHTGPRAEGIHAKTQTSLPRQDLSLLQRSQNEENISVCFVQNLCVSDHPDPGGWGSTFVQGQPYSHTAGAEKMFDNKKNNILHLIDSSPDWPTKTPED